jgi:hypothetical protein
MGALCRKVSEPMRKSFFLIITFFIVSIIIFACNQEEESMPTAPISLEQIFYARDMFFDWMIFIDGEPLVVDALSSGPVFERIIIAGGDLFDPYYDELVFVRNKEEAVGFAESTVVAWPPNDDIAQGMVNGLHLGKLRGDIDLESFGLTYPITINDLVEEWEKVRNLMTYIVSERRLMGVLLSVALRDGADAYMLEIEAHRLIGDREIVAEISRRGFELGMWGNAPMELLLVAGSAEEFFTIADRMEKEGLTLEEIMEELQE